jgi:hypothetical protein
MLPYIRRGQRPLPSSPQELEGSNHRVPNSLVLDIRLSRLAGHIVAALVGLSCKYCTHIGQTARHQVGPQLGLDCRIQSSSLGQAPLFDSFSPIIGCDQMNHTPEFMGLTV